MTRHYLDYNATTPIRPEVIDVMAQTMAHVGNSSSVHEEGRSARAIVEDARESLRVLVNGPVNGVIFTGGGTEAIHYGLHGLAMANTISRIFVSAIEHAAVPANAQTTGLPVETIGVTPSGVLDLEALRDRLKNYDTQKDGVFLMCLMFANNETGVLQPVPEAAEIVHEAGGLMLVDAAQAAGKVPVNFVMSGADLMVATAHKFGGPLGIGALIAGPNLPLAPVMRGGGHENNRRAGTHNVPAIAGLGVACKLAAEGLGKAQDIAAKRDRMQAAVAAQGAIIWGDGEARLPGTLSFSAPGFTSATQLMAMDLAGIAISSGSACSSGKTKPSHVLTAMGADEEQASCGVRVSAGWATSDDDIDAFCREWPAAYARIK